MSQSSIGPTNIRYEAGVLGAALWSEKGMTTVLDQARLTDFADPGHQLLFDAMQAIAADGYTPTADIIANRLSQQGNLARLGNEHFTGLAYLDHLQENSALASNLPHYFANLRSCSSARLMISVGAELVGAGQSLTAGDPDQIAEAVSSAENKVFALADETVVQNFESIADIVEEGYNTIINGPEDVEVIPTGFIDLDKKLHGGLRPQQVIVAAARPAVGKSVFGLNVAAHAAIHRGIPAVFYSLEMNRVELATRLIATEAKVNLGNLQEGTVTPTEQEKIRAKIEDLKEAPLYIDDTAGMDIAKLTSSIRFMRRRYGVKLVVVDYIQLVAGTKNDKSRQEIVGEVSRQLKVTAKQEGVAIIAIAQLNRGPEQRGGKPQISDLRESGTLEQDADIVILFHREEMYDADSQRQGEADFLLVKQRAGTTGTIPMAFLGHYSTFADMARFG